MPELGVLHLGHSRASRDVSVRVFSGDEKQEMTITTLLCIAALFVVAVYEIFKRRK